MSYKIGSIIDAITKILPDRLDVRINGAHVFIEGYPLYNFICVCEDDSSEDWPRMSIEILRKENKIIGRENLGTKMSLNDHEAASYLSVWNDALKRIIGELTDLSRAVDEVIGNQKEEMLPNITKWRERERKESAWYVRITRTNGQVCDVLELDYEPPEQDRTFYILVKSEQDAIDLARMNSK